MRSVSIIFVLSIVAYFLPQVEHRKVIAPEDAVASILTELGDGEIDHLPDTSNPKVSVEAGKNIVLFGNVDGKTSVASKKQSKHFVCTSCHNVVKENPDLSKPSPEARLDYAIKNKIPFLQGTALYGAVNRTSFYNGDYEKKYGDLVEAARNNLREAIQLCAVECSQGRALKSWELESVLSYLWTIDLKIEDLNLSPDQLVQISEALNEEMDKAKAIKIIKSKYLPNSPANFVDPPTNREEGFAYQGNPENGKWIYELSCQHCHEKKRYSHFNLDDTKHSFKHLNKHITRYTRYSVYQVTRYGTSPKNFKRAYMPQYTKEKMSNQQLADLRAYIESRADS